MPIYVANCQRSDDTHDVYYSLEVLGLLLLDWLEHMETSTCSGLIRHLHTV